MFNLIVDFIGSVEIAIAGVGLILFAASYAFFFNWKKTPAGRALMYFATSIIALFIDDSFSRLFGTDYFFRDIYQLAVYTGIMLATLRMLWVLWREWSRSRHIKIEVKPDAIDAEELQDAN